MNRSRLDRYVMQTEGMDDLTREKLEAVQLKKLNEVLRRVKARGGFYRDYPDSLSSLEELKTLPFTTAAQLGERPMQFLTRSQSEVERVISGATSGTSGPAKRVFYTGADTDRTVGFFAAGIGEMLSPGESCLVDFPFTGPFGLGDLIARAVEQLGGIPVKGCPEKSWAEQLALLEGERPCCYIGFPVRLLSLTRLWGRNFPVRRALVSADACPRGVMTALEKKLGSRLYPHYGSREMGLGGAVTCPAFHGMHLRENHILAEIVDEKGNVLPEGEFGELVITTIGMEAMPLIRYRTGDYTRFLPQCPCGAVTRRLDRVSRREPGPVAMEDLDSLLFAIEGVGDLEAWLDGPLHIHARVLDSEAERTLGTALEKGLPGVECTLTTEALLPSHHPMYPGKRYIRKK